MKYKKLTSGGFFVFELGLKSAGFYFWKYKNSFLLKKYKNFFNIRARKFHSPEHKELFSKEVFFGFGVKSGAGSPVLYNFCISLDIMANKNKNSEDNS